MSVKRWIKRKSRKSYPIKPAKPFSKSTALWLHGLAAMGDERWEDAAAAFQQFLEAKADLKSQAMAYSNLSACYLALERYEEALDALDEVERSTPDDPENVRSRGVIYACAGRISEALATFEKLVRRWPRQARRFETQNALRQIADFFYEPRIVVFVDGSPHHRDYVQEADRRKRNRLKGLGYRVTVVKPEEPDAGLDELAARLE